MATAMVIVGLSARFRVVFLEANDSPGAIVAGAALIALAVGIRVPHRFAIFAISAAWRRLAGNQMISEFPGAMIQHRASDRALYWLVLAVVALAGGVAIALLPFSVSTVSAFYEWMNAHFLWSNVSLFLLQTIAAFAAGAIPLAVLSLSISCVHYLCCCSSQWEIDATAWVLMGAALGTLIAAHGIGSKTAADLVLAASSLPILVVAIAAAFMGASGDKTIVNTVELPPVLPLWSDRWPKLLRASIVAVGGGSACAMFVWVEILTSNAPLKVGMLPALFVALAVGLLGGARLMPPGLRSIGGFGAACNVAGILVAIGAAARSLSEEAWAAAFILACAGLVSIGFVTAYGRQTLLIRVAGRSSAGAVELGRLLVCAGLTVLVGAPLAVHLFGATAALIMLAVSLVAIGGTLVIHDPAGSPMTRRVRLIVQLVSMGTMLLLCRVVSRAW